MKQANLIMNQSTLIMFPAKAVMRGCFGGGQVKSVTLSTGRRLST